MRMKISLLLGAATLTLLAVGCVKTVNDRHTAAVPLTSDKALAKYQRPVEQVYEAAKSVMLFNGTISRETSLLGSTNTIKCIEGKVNQRNVWIRVESGEPNLTSVAVQVRTKWGGTDDPLAYELDKQIALKLVQ